MQSSTWRELVNVAMWTLPTRMARKRFLVKVMIDLKNLKILHLTFRPFRRMNLWS